MRVSWLTYELFRQNLISIFCFEGIYAQSISCSLFYTLKDQYNFHLIKYRKKKKKRSENRKVLLKTKENSNIVNEKNLIPPEIILYKVNLTFFDQK